MICGAHGFVVCGLDVGEVHICFSHGDHAHTCPYRTLGMGMLNGIHMVVIKKEKPMHTIR